MVSNRQRRKWCTALSHFIFAVLSFVLRHYLDAKPLRAFAGNALGILMETIIFSIGSAHGEVENEALCACLLRSNRLV